MPNLFILTIKSAAGIFIQFTIFSLFILGPSGNLYWDEGLVWLLSYLLVVFPGTIYLLLKNPKSIEARFRVRSRKMPPGDRAATLFLVIALAVGIVLCPMDVFYWQIAAAPTGTLKIIGLIIFIVGLMMVMASMAVNEFVAPTVHIQEEEGHKLIDSGVYAYVRHPMYTGFVLFMLGSFLWLGTYFSLIAGSILTASGLFLRIRIEEKALIHSPDGYEQYMKKVKSRIIPFII